MSAGEGSSVAVGVSEEVKEARTGVTTVNGRVQGGNPGDGGGVGAAKIITDLRWHGEADSEPQYERLDGRRFRAKAVYGLRTYIYDQRHVRDEICVEIGRRQWGVLSLIRAVLLMVVPSTGMRFVRYNEVVPYY